jgi:sulfur-oxidizing protein SoxY
MTAEVSRRHFLTATGAAACAIVAGTARATPETAAAAIKEVLGSAAPQKGRVKLDLPVLIENGNTVAMTVSVDAPLTGPERVQSLHVFAEGNPLPNVANFHFGPRAGAARVSTRIRLATSQTVVAIARLADGSCWTDSIELMVVLAACLEE